MEFRVQETNEQISERIGKIGEELSESIKKALLITGLHGKAIIQDRMTSGRTIKGGDFEPYTGAYAAFRKAKGRSERPDLKFSKNMFSSITVKANSNQAEIFFSRGTEAKKAALNNKTRPFFGFNNSEKKELLTVFSRHLK